MPSRVNDDDARTQRRELLVFMRCMLLLGALLVFIAGVQLFAFSRETDRAVAWTIGVPLTAAFLGAFYWGAFPLALLSGLQREWVDARVGVPGIIVFLWCTLATTLLHLSKFHLHEHGDPARGAAWLWLFVYVAVPPVLTVAWFLQVRAPGSDSPRSAPLPSWFRIVIAVQALVITLAGVALFAAPGWTNKWWPWPLVPLTARAIGSWLLGLAAVAAGAVFENDFRRIRVAFASYLALSILQLVAAARFHDELHTGARTWLYVAFWLVAFAIGAFGWLAGRASRAGLALRPRETSSYAH
jgi:hypothetical protein